MDQILEQVKRARRRLSLELFLNRLLQCWFAAAIIAVVAVALPKLVAIENLPTNWTAQCAWSALLTGMLVAGLWTWWRGKSDLDSAIEIDRRYGLRERVASSLLLSTRDAETPTGKALLADTIRVVRRVDLDEQFRIQVNRRTWVPLVPAVLAFLLVTLVDNRSAHSKMDPTTEMTQEQRENATKALRELLADRRKQAAKKGLKNAEGLFRELEKQTEQMAEARDQDRKKTLVKMNDLAKQLEKRRDQLSGTQELRKQFKKMGKLNRGPADKMVDAMKQGNWQNAMKELSKLKQQLESGKLDEQAKKDLQEQLRQLQEKMVEAAQARKQAMEELKKQIEEQQRQGNLSRAGELQQKIDQLQQKQNKLDKLGQLAQQMAQCQECMNQGDSQGAAAALDQMMKQMEQLAQELGEGELLEAALDQLQMAKDALGCQQCQGQGCQACQGGAGNRFGEKPGNGMGPGRGFGRRPDEKNNVNFRDSRVRQNPGKGSAVVVGEADGGNVRGQVMEAIKEQMTSEASEPADPMVIEQLPKSHREQAEEYFNLFREGR